MTCMVFVDNKKLPYILCILHVYLQDLRDIMQKIKAIIYILFGLCVLLSSSQELPPIEVYTPETYKAQNQNWAISQAKDKTVYVANNAGLLELDGERWRLYPSPNESIMRSVNAVNGYIYSGFYMEFGYWKKNNLGTLDYTSLSKKLKTPLIEDEQFWNIIAVEDWVLFQSLNRIYIYNLKTETFKIIESKTTITKIYEVEGSIYFQRINNGIFKIESGKDILMTNAEPLKENIVVNIFKRDDTLFFETQDDGFYTYYNDILKPWDAPINNELKTLSIYNSIQLHDGSFALGTISNGIIILTKEGKVKYRINQTNGLSNNTVLSLFQDIEHNIWLGLDNGINCMNMNSNFKVYNDYRGELGAVYAAAVHKEILYLGTNQGLFYKTLNKNENFTFIEGTQGQVWCLLELDGKLFCGHNAGTFIVEKNKIEKISNIQGTWNIKAIKNNPNVLIQGNYDGLYILKKNNNKWQYSHKIEGFDISSRFFEFINNKELFVSHEYKGVLKVKLNDNYTKALNIEIEPISKGLKSSLSKYNNSILYAYKDGIFKYDREMKKFLKDTLLMSLYNSKSFVSGKLIVEPKTDRLWGFSNNEISFISPGKFSKTPELSSIPLPYELRKSTISFENVISIDNEHYLLGTTSGYILINLEKPFDKEYKTRINLITKNKNRNNDVIEYVDKSIAGRFNNDENNIEIFYSIPEYNKYLKVEYQYQLIGIYDNWSEWSSNSSELFENLPYGDYTFNVRGRINNNRTQNTATYSFTIQRPWYLSNAMIAVYVISLILFSLMMHNIYKQYYKKQRKKLLEQKNKELELKELANQEQSMRFKNESLTKDIESKNRELAISTMSLIKKNEFLNSIKNELINIKDDKKIKPVINIIDKNLNNTNDWELFQEAFNNADKDFLKKIKTLHPVLTPNDLRLCAYLRLNLSSKEIAPLLNISTRSVEVKRYRLRKKMNLPHESSLTNYIIEL